MNHYIYIYIYIYIGSPVPGILQARILEWGAIALFVRITHWCPLN